MQVRFVVRNLEKVQEYIRSLPPGTVKVGLEAIAEYIIGNTSHGLRHDEPQKYISREDAGYKTSAAQRRYFFAVGIWESDGQGGVKVNHYKRSGETAAAWSAVATNSGYGQSLRNPKIGAYYTRHMTGQTRQHKMAGRRNVLKVVMDNLAGAMRRANAMVDRFLKG